MTTATRSLPVVSLLNEFMKIQSYLQVATTIVLPPIITGNSQNATLVTAFSNWQQNLWLEFWEGLAANLTAESTEIVSLYRDGISDESSMRNVLFNGGQVSVVVALCESIAGMVVKGQPLLAQLENIAQSIENADREMVAQLQTLVAQLQTQFNQQEDTLTHDAIASGVDLVAMAVSVTIAIASEGEAVQPLIKGVIKIGEQAINELQITSDISSTLAALEEAWAALDQASANLALVSQVCSQLQEVINDTSPTLIALQTLSDLWSTMVEVTDLAANAWENGGSGALRQWATEMVRLSFGNATQSI